MTKSDFLDILRERISHLPKGEVAKTVVFYSEMIDDRMEDGMDEESAVEALGTVDSIVEEVCAGIGTEEENTKKETAAQPSKKSATWKLVLLILGSPLWITLIAAAVAIVLAIYITVLSVIWGLAVSFIAVLASLLLAGPAGIVVGAIHFFAGSFSAALTYAGMGLFLLGFGLFTIRPVTAYTKLSVKTTVNMLNLKRYLRRVKK